VWNNSYYWLDGNPSTYRNWESSEPDIYGKRQCVLIYDGKFYDTDCTGNYRYHYVCKGIYLF